MGKNAEPTLSPGRGAYPSRPSEPRLSAGHSTRTQPAPRNVDLEALGSLVVASSVLGIGAALIDYGYPTTAHPPEYYYGWILLAVGFASIVWTFAENILEPIWGHVGLIGLGTYGWWNTTWSVLVLWGGGNPDSAHGQVILGNFGAAWPFDGGLLEVPYWLFVLSTIVGLVAPPAAYLARRHSSKVGSRTSAH